MLAKPGAAALQQGCENGGGGIDSGEDIGDGDADFLRLTAGFARDRHQARHALNDEIIASAVGVGAGLAKAGDRAVDQLGVDFAQGRIVEAVFGEAADFEILNQHIGVGDQFTDGFLTFGRAEIAGY